MIPLIRRFVVVAASAAALTMLCGSLPLIAQEPKTSPAETKTKAKADRPAGDPARRVPRFFAQLGLSAEQREEIYKIQGKHIPKIESLVKQTEELRAQMLEECEGVLTHPTETGPRPASRRRGHQIEAQLDRQDGLLSGGIRAGRYWGVRLWAWTLLRARFVQEIDRRGVQFEPSTLEQILELFDAGRARDGRRDARPRGEPGDRDPGWVGLIASGNVV